MSEETIGRGTWYDMMAKKVIEREQSLSRSTDKIRTEMGLGASGFPHIGSLGDAARSYTVTLALKNLGFNSELLLTVTIKMACAKFLLVYLRIWRNILVFQFPVYLTRLVAMKATANT